MEDSPAVPSSRSPYIPLFIGLFALLCLLGFQSYELMRARSAISQVREGQTAPIADAEKMRRLFNSLAGATAVLAQQGNADAKAIVDEFARRGLSFRPPPAR